MADKEISASSNWGEALDDVLAANEEIGKEPSTLGELYRRLEAHPDSRQTARSWKTTVKRMREKPPTEVRAQMIADVLEVDRGRLPAAAERLSARAVEIHLEALEAKVDRGLEVTAASLEDLNADVEQLFQRLSALDGGEGRRRAP